jgi:hypothetical protein
MVPDAPSELSSPQPRQRILGLMNLGKSPAVAGAESGGNHGVSLVNNGLVKRALSDWAGLVAWVVVVAVVTFISTKRLWFDGLHPGEKALFWTDVAVAAGTLALAIVTVASVLETRAVIRGEDRRHQQGYAPFLTLGDHFNTGADYENGYTLWNKGDGIALNVSFQVRGRATVATFNFPLTPATVPLLTIEDQRAYREKYKALEYYDLDDRESLSASFPGGYETFWQEIMRRPPGALSEIE